MVKKIPKKDILEGSKEQGAPKETDTKVEAPEPTVHVGRRDANGALIIN